MALADTRPAGAPLGSLAEDERLHVLVVDDQEVVHWGFRALLARRAWVESYAAAASVDAALEAAAREQPHVALVGGALSVPSAAELIRGLAAVSPRTRVLLVVARGSVSARAARVAGARGLVPRQWPARDIADAARMVGLGMTVFAPTRRPAPCG